MELTTLIPGVLTGVAALVAAFAAILKSDSNKKRKDSNEEVTSDAVDLIEKIVDSQTSLNRMLTDEIAKQKVEIEELKKQLSTKNEGET